MKIKLLHMHLKNFKGIKDLEINFEGKNTNIYGRNATGKTTIFDAFKWLFFDKDSNDRKDFNIKTLDSNNNPIHFLEHEVMAELDIDGIRTTFRKMYQEKWTRKRGQEQQEFSGHETNYYIDEIPVKKKEFEERINNIIPENQFKLITDPGFFNNIMSWQERRKLLMNLSGADINDEQILEKNDQFNELKEKLKGRTVEDYKKVVQAKIKDLNKEKEQIPVRIDELTSTLITNNEINYEILEKNKSIYNEELKKYNDELTNIEKRTEENMKKVNALSAAKMELNDLKFKLEVEHSNKYSSETIKLNNDKSYIENNIRILTNEIKDRNLKITECKAKKEELYRKWDEVISKTLELNQNEFICPTCKREYETETIEEMKEEFIKNFNEQIEREKADINSEGQLLNEIISENESKVNELAKKLSKYTEELTTIDNKMQENEKLQENNKQFDVTETFEYREKAAKVEKLQQEVNLLTSEDTTYIYNKRSEFIEEINEIDKKLNERDTQQKTKQRISELEEKEKEISNNIQELEKQQYAIEEFTKTKVELLEAAINSKFKIVKFRLFDTQINGGLIECCDTLVNGVPYNDVNNAHKIIAGLDIINTLMEFYKVSAPIFIDNRESINELYNVNTQIISLIVTEDPVLRIEVV